MPEARTINHQFLDQSYEIAGRVVDPLAGTISWNGQIEHVRRKQLEVLALLVSANGECVPRQHFLSEIWGDNALVGERGLNDTIFSLRKALRDEETSQPLIRTIPRRGYQLSGKLVLHTDSRAHKLKPGTQVPGKPAWKLTRLLGESEVASTWLAEHSAQSSRCAVRFSQSEQHLRRVQREVTLLRYLREALAGSPRIVRILDWRLADPPYYVVMDYVSGGNLATWSQTSASWPTLNIAQRLQLILDLVEGLAAIHAALVVHQNLNAEALLIEVTEAGPRGKLGGFGRGRLSDHQRLNLLAITAAGMDALQVDAPQNSEYVAPEVMRGTLSSFDSDIYAVGVLIAKILVGDLGALPQVALAGIEPGPLHQLVLACLSEPAARPSAKDLSRDIRRLLQGDAADAKTDFSDRVPEMPVTGESSLPMTNAETVSYFDGRYRPLERLGEGGMGQVFLAEQREPVRRQVALKIGRDGPEESLLQATFERERQALASMRHPNIPAIFDAGVTASGRPFIAMELAGRTDLVSHCNHEQLSIQDRIRLFCQVCDAIEHAHQHGLIHRDIKPGNLLVQAHENRPAQVKVVDFGVAKAFQAQAEELELELRLGATVGTPLYCSPEQLGSQSDSVDTRSDIYSLGVVLFELLVGVTPYTPEAMANLLRREISPLQSALPLVSMTERLRQISEPRQREFARLRGLEPKQHLRSLKGDLESIVEKCLSALPQGRYASVSGLRQDLQNWLDHRAVNAGPMTVSSRFSRLRRRYRWSTPVAAAFVAALLVSIVVIAREYIEVDRSFASAQKSLEEAHAAAQFRVTQIQTLDPTQMGLDLRDNLSGALKQALQAHPSELLNGAMGPLDQDEFVEEFLNQLNFSDLTLQQLDHSYLQPMAERASAELTDSPELQAKIWQSIGDTLLALGRAGSASIILERAERSRVTLFGDDDPQTLETKRSLGLSELALGLYNDAVPRLDQAYKGHLAALGEDHLQTLRSQEALAKGYLAHGKTNEALVLYESALTTRRKVFGADAASTMEAELVLAAALSQDKQFEPARKILESLRDKVNATPAAQPSLRVRTLHALALLLSQRSSDASSEDATRAAYRAALDLYGPRHSISLELSNDLANLLRFRGKLVEAERLHRENLRLRTQTLGARHPETLRSMSNLGFTLLSIGQWSSAEPLLIQAETTTKTALGESHSQWLSARRRVGLLRLEQGRLEEAKSIFLELHETRSKLFGPDDWRTIRALSDIAETHRRQGDLAAAERLQRQVVGSFRAIDFAADPLANSQLCDLGRILTEAKKYQEAESSLQQCADGVETILGKDHLVVLQAQHAILDFLAATGRTEEAISVGKRLAADASKVMVPEDPQLGVMLLSYAKALSLAGRHDEALTQFDDAWNALSRAGQSGIRLQALHMPDFKSVHDRLKSAEDRGADPSVEKIWGDRLKRLRQSEARGDVAMVE